MIKINEIFFSIQGESTRVGLPTVFVRTSGCPLRCNYCDTPESIGEPPTRMEHVVWPAGRKDPVRRQLKQDADKTGEDTWLFVTLDASKQSLSVWPEATFSQRAAQLEQSQRTASQTIAYERIYFALSHRVEMDKQGRVRLPDRLLQMSKLGSDVTVVGVNDHLEIWDRNNWDAFLDSQLADHPELLMHPRQAMKPEDQA